VGGWGGGVEGRKRLDDDDDDNDDDDDDVCVCLSLPRFHCVDDASTMGRHAM
jgi:hypothetical protein